MRALITGATGYIGRALVRLLLQEGHKATALVRSRKRSQPDPVEELRGLGAEVVEGTVFDADVLAQALAGQDVIFHIAWHWERPEGPGAAQTASIDQQWHENVEGTRLLIEAGKKAGMRRLVFTSTVWVYPASAPSPLHEDGVIFAPDTVGGHPAENYIAPKLAVEEMIRYLLPPPEYVILRPSLTYGVGAKWAPDLIKGMLQGPPRRHVRPENWVHVDDVARATLLAAEVAGASGMTFNIAGRETVGSDQMREAVQRLAARLAHEPSNKEQTVFPLITPRFDISMARQHLGFAPQISLAEGMEEMIAAMLPELPTQALTGPATMAGQPGGWGARRWGGNWRQQW